MRIAKGLALLGVFAMGVTLLYGFAAGDFAKEGGDLLSMPWGIVSLVDLYVGFVLFSGWIVFRENSLTRATFWVAAVMLLGFFSASLYAFVALHTSEGDWTRFWMGRRASSASTDR